LIAKCKSNSNAASTRPAAAAAVAASFALLAKVAAVFLKRWWSVAQVPLRHCRLRRVFGPITVSRFLTPFFGYSQTYMWINSIFLAATDWATVLPRVAGWLEIMVSMAATSLPVEQVAVLVPPKHCGNMAAV